MEPIITLRVNWRRLGEWLLIRILWFPLFLKDCFADDWGPDAHGWMGLALAFDVGVIVLWTLINLGFVLGSPSTIGVLSLIVYAFLGLMTDFLLRFSGLFDEGFLPRA